MRRWRRKRGSKVWHFCTNCSNWPKSTYDEVTTKPTSGKFDTECRSKDANGNCR
ncbi:MAG: hypothetical protein M3537_10120 [Chloroflexota bacterium]|nr:hypothetical protein [Chloroflexota bacterium]